ncbi:MAG: acyl-CoA synthetase FdrA, partial [Oligoflexia bacterium]|nr:acyl-CoA synthetase FdrA [Oligoflexia bacterium]
MSKVTTKTLIKSGEYYDSVTIMMLAKKLQDQAGVVDSAVVMGSKENLALLLASGMSDEKLQSATHNDLVIVVKSSSEELAIQAITALERELSPQKKATTNTSNRPITTFDSACEQLPGANLALISVAGAYAGSVARNALEKGLHVLLFSDNVSLEEEVELKKLAVSKQLLLMGPDCGTAIINGTPLAFANKVKQGAIGIVGASGTGTQEVTTLISNWGGGISQAIGTGGRDLKEEVGGLTFLLALEMLAADPKTKVIVMISKPPHKSVMEKIFTLTKKIKDKPLIALFLGADNSELSKQMPNITFVQTLEEAAFKSLEAIDIVPLKSSCEENLLVAPLVKKISKRSPKAKYLRAHFSGGTFAIESHLILSHEGIAPLYSNLAVAHTQKLGNVHVSQGHTILDLGEDEFTVGRPHPMIDFSLRHKRILEDAANKETALILLDLVLGYGSHLDPLSELLPLLKQVQEVPMIFSVCGTDLDPQVRS